MAGKTTAILATHIEALGTSKKFQKNIANRVFLKAFKKYLKGSRLGAYIFTTEEVLFFFSKSENTKYRSAYNMSKYSTPISGALVLRKDIALNG